MITFIGLFLLFFALCAQAYLEGQGRYDLHVHRRTDWWVMAPGFGGIASLLYVAFVLCVRWFP